MRNRIGKKQQALLLHLDLIGPLWFDELSQNDQRSIKSLERQGKVQLSGFRPLRAIQLKE